MKKLFFVLFFAVLVFSSLNPVISLEIGNLEIVKGNISVLKADNINFTWQEANNGMLLNEGDKIKSSSDTYARVNYNDGAQVRIREHTLMELRAETLRLLIGDVWVQMVKRGNTFEVHTPSVVAGVRGTRFEVKTEYSGDSRVAVAEGLVAVRGAGKEVMVPAGNLVECRVSQTPGPMSKFDSSALQQSWDNTSGSDIDVIITAPDNKADNMQDAKVLYLEAQYIFNKAKAENKMTEEIKEKFRNALRNYQQLRREFLNK